VASKLGFTNRSLRGLVAGLLAPDYSTSKMSCLQRLAGADPRGLELVAPRARQPDSVDRDCDLGQQ
jgi:hypothetical protein